MADDVFGIVGSVIASAYHVEGVVAEGGFGVVYRAHHGGFRAPVALKLLKVPQAGAAQQNELLELFRAEAELLFRLSASLPTVVRPLHIDAFTASDGRFVPYLVLEWLEGLTLGALIAQRAQQGLPPVGLRKLVRLLTPVARALEKAHDFHGPQGRLSIVHRDLKPENIFIAQLAGEEVVKILDFGIGKVKSAASQVAGRMSQTGAAPMAFTPAYGAPEQWAPRHYGQTGPWTDVWGLALTIVEVLAGRPIINGDPATMMGIALDERRRPTPRNEGVDLPDEVEAVFERALALDPRDRQPDAGAFWNELVSALGGTEVGAPARDPRAESVPLRPRASGLLPRVTPAVEQALAMDLEFDPVSVSQPRLVVQPPMLAKDSASSGQHFVPDLELAPPSRRPNVARPAAEPRPSPVVPGPPRSPLPMMGGLELDEPSSPSASLDLALDLAANEPLPRQRQSSPPASGAQVARSALPAHTSSEPPRRASLPPPAPEPAVPELGFVARIERNLPQERPLLARLRWAFVALSAAVLVALIDPIHAALTGEMLVVFGLRLSVLAGALLLVALGLGARELLRASDL